MRCKASKPRSWYSCLDTHRSGKPAMLPRMEPPIQGLSRRSAVDGVTTLVRRPCVVHARNANEEGHGGSGAGGLGAMGGDGLGG